MTCNDLFYCINHIYCHKTKLPSKSAYYAMNPSQLSTQRQRGKLTTYSTGARSYVILHGSTVILMLYCTDLRSFLCYTARICGHSYVILHGSTVILMLYCTDLRSFLCYTARICGHSYVILHGSTVIQKNWQAMLQLLFNYYRLEFEAHPDILNNNNDLK
jgi:hypothetical protein